MSEPLLSPKSVAARWDCKRPYVYAQIKAGELEVVRFGPRMVRIPLSSVEQFEKKLWPRGEPNDTEGDGQLSPDTETANAALSSMRMIGRALKQRSAG